MKNAGLVFITVAACLLLGAGCDTYQDDVGRDPIRSTIAGHPDEATTYTDRVRAANERRVQEESENPTFKEGHSSGTNFQGTQGPLDSLQRY